MKKIMGTTAVLFIVMNLTAQPLKQTAQPAEKKATVSAPKSLSDSTGKAANFGKDLFLQPLEVKAIRAAEKAPFTKTNLSKTVIEERNLAQDIPFILNQTPSVVINSDAGNGVGYTGIRIRGTDATRINVTLNGIPYNDAESMSTYFVDLPDFASSVNSIQIQRGVGTSSNGAGAFGGTINLSTNEFNEKAYTELNNSFGSFNTWKNTLKFGTGLMGKHFLLDGRLSNISSDGYVDRASSKLRSFYISTAYVNKKSSLRLNIFSGHEKTYQAWYGIDAATLASNRTYNPAGTEKPGTAYDDQTDNYTQTHYQLFYNHSLSEKWSFNTAVFLTRGKGYYEEYKADQQFSKYGFPNTIIGGSTITKTDLVRQRWLDNYFYGQIASLQYKDETNEFTFGGGWTQYDGKHYGLVKWLAKGTIPFNNHYYDLTAQKKDANIYAKWQHSFAANLFGFADIQYRNVAHDMHGFSNNPTLHVSRKFDFVNPKIGFTYIKKGWQSFISFATANKEPNREDVEAGTNAQPSHETLYDLELGSEKRNANYSYGATLYYMNYKNQLVLTGKINDVGAYTRTNIPASYRMGIELQATARLNNWMNIAGNLTISKNKIKSFAEYVDNYDTGNQDIIQHQNKDISFSANLIGNTQINFIPAKNFTLSLLNKYVGKQYLDNTQNENRKLNDFMVQDIRTAYTFSKKSFKEVSLVFQVNNLYNKKYEPNGYTFSYVYGGVSTTENYYYPMAGINFMAAVNIKL